MADDGEYESFGYDSDSDIRDGVRALRLPGEPQESDEVRGRVRPTLFSCIRELP